MPKATPRRTAPPGSSDPVAKRSIKDPKLSHLYTDDNPTTTLHGTGFKDAATARKTIDLVSKRSLLYQWQTINTMYHRAKHHPNKSKDMQEAIDIFDTWLKSDYPKQKSALRNFKPLLSKDLVKTQLAKIKGSPDIDSTFAEVYVSLGPRKRLANTLVNARQPGEPDWEQARYDHLCQICPKKNHEFEHDELWDKGGQLTPYHLELIAWAHSPVQERSLKSKLRL